MRLPIVTLALLCTISIFLLPSSAFSVRPMRTKLCSTRSVFLRSTQEEVELDEKLLNIAHKLKLEIFDLDEGIYGYDSRDQRYGLEVVKTDVNIDGGLGLTLTEVAGDADGRGLVLISDVSGNAAKADPPIQVGDVLTGIIANNHKFKERVIGMNYDYTVEAIDKAKEVTKDGILTLQLNRLVKRAKILVEVDDGSGEIQKIEALAGENLRRMLMRKGVQLYDKRAKRFDMPYATGDCGGDGLCGTCLVNVLQGMDVLNERHNDENLITRGRPVSWRASCRTVVGADNKPGTLRITLHPQSRYEDELDPGVRSLNP